jgi:signal transduction histidine kinase
MNPTLLHILPPSLAGTVSLALGVYIISLDPKREINRLFTCWLFLIAGGSLLEIGLHFLAGTSESLFLTRLLFLVGAAVASLLLQITLRFPEEKERTTSLPISLVHLPTILLAYPTLATGSVVALGPTEAGLGGFQPGPLFPLFIEYLILYSFLALGFLIRSYLRGNEGERQQLRYLILALMIPIFGDPLVLIVHSLWPSFPLLFSMNSALMAALFSFAIFTHRVTFRIESLIPNLENVLDSLTDGVILLDTGGKILFLNRAVHRHLRPDRELLSRGGFLEVFPGLLEREVWEAEWDAVLTAEKRFQHEGLHYPVPGKGDAVINLEMQPLRDSTRSIVGAILTLNFVTEKVRLQKELETYTQRLEERVEERTRELRKAYEELKELDRLKDEFLSNISHELKTPITISRSAIELGMEEDPKERDRFLAMGLDGLIRLNYMVGELLDISRMESDAYRLTLKPVDLREIVLTTVEEIRPLTRGKGIEIETSLPSEAVWISADEESLKRILYNLLTNAIKFNHEGGRVEVELTAGEEDVTVSVLDTGIGIPQERLAKVFDRFYQVDGTTTRPYPGVGIGLALVKRLVEMHQGTVSVESEMGRGSRFAITFPSIDAEGRKEKEGPSGG